jgi:hypothetical protein
MSYQLKIFFWILLFFAVESQIFAKKNSNPSIFIDVDLELQFTKNKKINKSNREIQIKYDLSSIEVYYQFDKSNSKYLIDFNDINDDLSFDYNETSDFIDSTFFKLISESNFFINIEIDNQPMLNIKNYISEFQIKNYNSQFILIFNIDFKNLSRKFKDVQKIVFSITDYDKVFDFKIYDDLTISKFWNYPINDYLFVVDDEVYDLIIELYLKTLNY